jgi:hypothetical protein
MRSLLLIYEAILTVTRVSPGWSCTPKPQIFPAPATFLMMVWIAGLMINNVAFCLYHPCDLSTFLYFTRSIPKIREALLDVPNGLFWVK